MAQSAPSEAPSCSPFGKKKKYKDKYLAKHSSSKPPGCPVRRLLAAKDRGYGVQWNMHDAENIPFLLVSFYYIQLPNANTL